MWRAFTTLQPVTIAPLKNLSCAIVACLFLAHVASAEDELKPGLIGEFFDLGRSVTNFPKLPPQTPPTLKRIDAAIAFDADTNVFFGTRLREHFFVRWTGVVKVSKKGKYNFCVISDDGARLFIDGKQIVDNGGLHSALEKCGEMELSDGPHDLELIYFQNDKGHACKLFWETKGLSREIIPSVALFHKEKTAGPPPIHSYTARLWQQGDGLPYNVVQSIFQTHDGYLWVGTQDGLARFNGTHFTVFKPDNVPELKDSSITSLYETRDGSLWIGTQRGGMTRFKDGVFSHHDLNFKGARKSVLAITESTDGALWIGTSDGVIQFKDGKFVMMDSINRKIVATDTDTSTVKSVCAAPDGTVWLGTVSGLFQARGDSIVTHYGYDTKGLPHDILRSVCRARNGDLWVGTMGGLSQLSKGKFTSYSKARELPNNTVNVVYQDRRDNIWIGTYGGICRWTGGRFIKETTDEGDSFGVVYCFLEDREGNIWAGTKDGVYRLTPKSFETYTTRQGLQNDNVMSVFEDESNTLWFATWGGGVHRMKNDEIKPWTVVGGKDQITDLLLGMHKGRDKTLWFGGDHQKGLFRVKDGQVVCYSRATGLMDSAVKVIYEDSRKNLWIGTREALDLFKDEKFTRYTSTNGLAGNMVRAILEDHDGNLWIGTDGGLTRWADGTFTTFTRKNGFVDNAVNALYEDAAHDLWIGTIGGGLGRLSNDEIRMTNGENSKLENRTAKFSFYTTRQGFYSDDVFEILEDDFGNLWMSCLKGIFRVNKKELDDLDQHTITSIHPVTYGREDGLVTPQCNGVAKPSGWKGHDGRLWFATAKGLAVTDPKISLRKTDTMPPVFIEEVVVDKKRVECRVSSVESQAADPVTRHSSPVTIPPGRGELEFHYAALSYTAPEKNRFRYKLEGLDNDWVEAGSRRTAFYNNIPPGHYTFRVIACNDYGVWNTLGANVNLTLQPYFWQRWWFKSFIVITGLSLAATGARLVTKRRMQLALERLERQHAVEKERIRIAQDMHDDLGARLTQILMLSSFASDEGRGEKEMKSQLGQISVAARDLVRNLDAIVWAVNPKHDFVDSLAMYLSEYMEMFLSGMPIRFRWDVPDTLPHDPISSEVRHNVFLAVKESLNNVVKHSGASEVWLRLGVEHETLTVTIEDNGKGCAVESPSKFGNGLVNMTKRMKTIGGSCEITSEPGKGTRIRLQVSIGNN
jgi:ligand-binding sensor domain-containing protein/signal transduction histidine kinase